MSSRLPELEELGYTLTVRAGRGGQVGLDRRRDASQLRQQPSAGEVELVERASAKVPNEVPN